MEARRSFSCSFNRHPHLTMLAANDSVDASCAWSVCGRSEAQTLAPHPLPPEPSELEAVATAVSELSARTDSVHDEALRFRRVLEALAGAAGDGAAGGDVDAYDTDAIRLTPPRTERQPKQRRPTHQRPPQPPLQHSSAAAMNARGESEARGRRAAKPVAHDEQMALVSSALAQQDEEIRQLRLVYPNCAPTPTPSPPCHRHSNPILPPYPKPTMPSPPQAHHTSSPQPHPAALPQAPSPTNPFPHLHALRYVPRRTARRPDWWRRFVE